MSAFLFMTYTSPNETMVMIIPAASVTAYKQQRKLRIQFLCNNNKYSIQGNGSRLQYALRQRSFLCVGCGVLPTDGALGTA